MGSPKRIFKNATTPEIEGAYDAALARLTNGEFTSLSGGGKSSTRKFVDPAFIMDEAQYELAIRNRTLGPSKVYQNFAHE